MRIAEFSVKNYQFTLIIFALLLAMGLNALFNMPRGEDPETESPSYAIVIVIHMSCKIILNSELRVSKTKMTRGFEVN